MEKWRKPLIFLSQINFFATIFGKPVFHFKPSEARFSLILCFFGSLKLGCWILRIVNCADREDVHCADREDVHCADREDVHCADSHTPIHEGGGASRRLHTGERAPSAPAPLCGFLHGWVFGCPHNAHLPCLHNAHLPCLHNAHCTSSATATALSLIHI